MVHQVLKHWTNDYQHFLRNLDEIKRTQDDNREFYESYTRNVRFECYRRVGGAFILGHNRDDSLENVISNIKKGRSYSNLLGMSHIGMEKEITLFRPLLGVWKRDIVAFAQKYKIPFVYDSTPSWSERGQMRDTLFPFLNQFDPRILDGLYHLATNFKEIYKVYEGSLPSITWDEKMCKVEDREIYFEDYMKRILQRIVSHYGLYPIRNKSVRHMIHTLQFDKSTQKITLSKQLICQKVEDQLLFFIV
jgi:tRNA(Ile)-lysidine synthase TilS/MesJ